MLIRSPAAPHRAGGERREGSEARAGRGRGAGCPGGGTRAAAWHAQGYVWRDGQGVLAARGGVWLVHLVGEVRLLHAEAGVQQAQVCHRDPASQRHWRAAHRPRAHQQHSGAQRRALPPWLRPRACTHTPPRRTPSCAGAAWAAMRRCGCLVRCTSRQSRALAVLAY